MQEGNLNYVSQQKIHKLTALEVKYLIYNNLGGFYFDLQLRKLNPLYNQDKYIEFKSLD